MNRVHILIGLIGAILIACGGAGTTDQVAQTNEIQKPVNDDLTKKTTNDNMGFETAEKVVVQKSKFLKENPDFKLSIKVTPYVPDYPNLSDGSKQLLSSRLNSAISMVGYGGDGSNPRFIIAPSINVLAKNLTSTAPTKFQCTYEVIVMVCDVVTETVFSSYKLEVIGVGDSPEKAFVNAFRDFELENGDFYAFMKQAEEKILSYFENNCDKFLQEAEALAKSREFEAAYTVLNNIPPDAATCYKTAMEKKMEYFQLGLNADCQSILASMKAELGKFSDPSAAGFNEPAMAYYSLIDKQSDCAAEADKLYNQYISKLNATKKRDWDFEMKKYQDELARVERLDQFKMDSVEMNFDYLKYKEEMMMKTEVDGNKKLMAKYQYDELPWIRRVFHLGTNDPFDRTEN